jgi:tetratricopeptide (TPR) repeat protein
MEVAVKIATRTKTIVLAGAALTAVLTLSTGCTQEIISSAPSARAQGIRQYEEGNFADAAGSFRNALRSDPRDYRSQFYLAQSYEQLKQYQQAIQAYKTSLEVQPRTLAGKEDKSQRLATINALAVCISKADNRDAETNLIEQAARNGNRAQDWLLLAKIHQNRGDADSALDAYNRGALSDPQDFTVAKENGLYLEQVGQTGKAKQQLRRAYTLNQNDEQVNQALRRLNIIPGPGLKDENALVKPPIPQGPLPEVDLSKFRIGGGAEKTEPQAQPEPSQVPAPPAMPPSEIRAPRD